MRFGKVTGTSGAPGERARWGYVKMAGMLQSEQVPLLAQLAELAGKYPDELNAQVRQFELGGRGFGAPGRPALMGVINLSRQSWYRESISVSTQAAIKRGRVLWAQGAAVIDLGAESTQSYADDISPGDQIASLLPVISALSAERVLVSTETYDPGVAQVGLAAGARVLNLTGVAYDEEMFALAARYEAAVVICFSQGDNVRVSTVLNVGDDPIPMLIDHFEPRIERAVAAGVSRIFIDPGLGFHYENLTDGAERVRYQSQVLLNSFRLRTLGWPICQALPRAFDFFEDNFRSAEPYFAVLAAMGRTDLLRTHEVSQVNAVLSTMDVLDIQ